VVFQSKVRTCQQTSSEWKLSQFSLVDAGVLHAPASLSDLMLTYKAGADLPELLERHIIELAEAEVIMRLQVGSSLFQSPAYLA
jgi:hypothetical protein